MEHCECGLNESGKGPCCEASLGLAVWVKGSRELAAISHGVTDLNIEPQADNQAGTGCPAMDAGEWAEHLRRALPVELTKLREARGLSKNELSARTGLARSFITTLEQGGAAPSVESLGRIAFALGISPGEILKRAEKHAGSLPRFTRNLKPRPLK